MILLKHLPYNDPVYFVKWAGILWKYFHQFYAETRKMRGLCCIKKHIFDNVLGDFMKITKNCIKCNHCGDIIVSEYRHDFKYCKCGKVAVDGGNDYLRRSFINSKDDFTELSEYEE